MNTLKPERHFLGWNESAAQGVARWLMARRESLAVAVDGASDFSSTLIIVPGAGARRQVLAALRRSLDGAMIPPPVATPGQFVASACATPAGSMVAGPLDRLTAMARALGKNDGLRHRLIPAARGTSLAALAPAARRLLDVIDGADDAHCSVENISRLEILSASPPMQAAWGHLAQLRRAMKGELAQMGRARGVELLERSDVIDLAAGPQDSHSAGWAPKCGAMILAGLPDLARNVAHLSRRLAQKTFNGSPVRVHALVLAPEECAACFDDLGVVLESGFASGPDLADSMIEAADDPADQAAAAVARYSVLAGGRDAGVTAIVLGDEALLPSIERTFAEHGRTVHAGSGLRFSETEIGRCLERLERAAHGDPAAFVELIRVPALAGARIRARPDLVHALDALRTEAKPVSAAALWARFEAAAGADDAGTARTIEEKLGGWLADLFPRARAPKPLGQRWAELEAWMSELFAPRREPEHQGAGGAAEASRATGEAAGSADENTSRALEEFIKTMQRAQESAAAGEMGTAADALSLALLLASDISIHDSADASSVDTVGWLETLFEPAQRFVVTGMHEGSLPSAPPADGWFNENIRRAIQLPGRSARLARDAYLFRALAARAGPDGLAVVAGRVGGDGDPLKPSRLLLPADSTALARRILLLTDQGAAPPAMRPQSQRNAGGRSGFARPPAARAEVPGVISATDFAVYIDNPYRYWLEKILKLDAPDPESTELNAAEFGTLLHSAAKSLGDADLARLDGRAPDYEERCRERMERRLRELADDAYGAAMRASIRLQTREIANRLRRLAAWHAEQVRAGWSIQAVEWPAAATIDVDGAPQAVSLQIDRIDFHPQRGWRILDYKSSDKGFDIDAKVFKPKFQTWVDLQLPLYKCLAPPAARAAADQAAGQYSALAGLAVATPDQIEVGVLALPASSDPPEWCPLQAPAESGLERAREVIRSLRLGKFDDTGRDPTGRFARVRRALCLSTAEEDDESDEDAA